MPKDMERIACKPLPVDPAGFNPNAVIPYGCGIDHIGRAMDDFLEFLGFLNRQFRTKRFPGWNRS